MHIISMFAAKGGAGRTVTTMALASGFLAQGKRVAVMDCSDNYRACLRNGSEPVLRAWGKKVKAQLFETDQLAWHECATVSDVDDGLAAADTYGVDVVIADTPARPLETALAMFAQSDLLLAPAGSRMDAKTTSERLPQVYQDCDQTVPAAGIVSGCRYGPDMESAIRAEFNGIHALQTVLPDLETYGAQPVNGYLSHTLQKLQCKRGASGFAEYREAQAAWTAVQQLTTEIQWLLDGYALAPNEDAPTPQLSLVRAAQ